MRCQSFRCNPQSRSWLLDIGHSIQRLGTIKSSVPLSPVTLDHLIANEPDMVILVGDLTYADDHLLVGSCTSDAHAVPHATCLLML